MAPKLSPVYAIADGVVTRVDDSPRAGRYLMIEHEDGWESWYLHLNNDVEGRDNGRAAWELTVVDGLSEGAVVSAGSHIAFVGDSGNAEGAQSHTHFELHLGSRILNPWPYLVAGQQEALDRLRAAEVEAVIREVCPRLETRSSVDAEVCPDNFEYLGPRREGPRGVY
jgi:murein DD-endopeptidase MepM/ murein hydrolase activator NlpD